MIDNKEKKTFFKVKFSLKKNLNEKTFFPLSFDFTIEEEKTNNSFISKEIK